MTHKIRIVIQETMFANIEGKEFTGILLADTDSIQLKGTHRYGGFRLEIFPDFPLATLEYERTVTNERGKPRELTTSITYGQMDKGGYDAVLSDLRGGKISVGELFIPMLPSLEAELSKSKNIFINEHDTRALYDLQNMRKNLEESLTSTKLTVVPEEPSVYERPATGREFIGGLLRLPIGPVVVATGAAGLIFNAGEPVTDGAITAAGLGLMVLGKYMETPNPLYYRPHIIRIVRRQEVVEPTKI